ncbi:Flp family type IVb pilin [Tessaracoccus sp. MC1865]|uniref:Flp family type IVb pilin n=1 Tax=Tessaracoccus sp. MC1865 TaxID=2760310 RepID=UPI001AE671F9|nr:Flp family type IVb pilin [Tessaracoccus sp. MC1865]QTO38316.1 Flp family type IVb pilin [Tessaracoccus sp. MC1865]
MFDYMQAVLRGVIAPRMKSEKGATAVEYGIMVAAIAVVIIAIVFTLGGQLNDLFKTVSEKLPTPKPTP